MELATRFIGLGETGGYAPPPSELAAILVKDCVFRCLGASGDLWFVRKNDWQNVSGCAVFWGDIFEIPANWPTFLH